MTTFDGSLQEVVKQRLHLEPVKSIGVVTIFQELQKDIALSFTCQQLELSKI